MLCGGDGGREDSCNCVLWATIGLLAYWRYGKCVLRDVAGELLAAAAFMVCLRWFGCVAARASWRSCSGTNCCSGCLCRGGYRTICGTVDLRVGGVAAGPAIRVVAVAVVLEDDPQCGLTSARKGLRWPMRC